MLSPLSSKPSLQKPLWRSSGQVSGGCPKAKGHKGVQSIGISGRTGERAHLNGSRERGQLNDAINHAQSSPFEGFHP